MERIIRMTRRDLKEILAAHFGISPDNIGRVGFEGLIDQRIFRFSYIDLPPIPAPPKPNQYPAPKDLIPAKIRKHEVK